MDASWLSSGRFVTMCPSSATFQRRASVAGDPLRSPSTHHTKRLLGVAVVLLAVAVSGCSGEADTSEGQESAARTASRGEQGREGGAVNEFRSGENEESGVERAVDAIYDEVRNGARLMLAYDAGRNVFSGTVENMTDEPLRRVRVEVHLSNGTELGPTPPMDLGADAVMDITLSATRGAFDTWSAHVEVGNEEHGDEEGEEEDAHE